MIDVAILDSRYPCCEFVRLHVHEHERDVDVWYYRTCPVCKAQWKFRRAVFISTPQGRVDKIQWQRQ